MEEHEATLWEKLQTVSIQFNIVPFDWQLSAFFRPDWGGHVCLGPVQLGIDWSW